MVAPSAPKSVRHLHGLLTDNHVARVAARAPRLRVAIGTHLKRNNYDAGRVEEEVRRIILATAQETAAKYGFTFDKNDPWLKNEVELFNSRLHKTVLDVDPIARQQVLRILPTGLKVKEVNDRLEQVRGLDARSALALERYRQRLETAKKRATDKQIESSVQRYRRELITRRANLVATHETAKAVAVGQEVAVQVAVRDGQLDAATTLKVWVAREECCHVCAKLSGQEVGINDYFETQETTWFFPPVHPHCMCTYYVKVA